MPKQAIETSTNSKSRRIAAAAAALLIASALVMASLPLSLAHADAKTDLDAANQAASDASAAYDAAQTRVDEASASLAEKQAQVADREQNQLPQARAEYNAAIKQMYMSSSEEPVLILSALLAGGSLTEVLSMIDAYDHISKWREDALSGVAKARDELTEAKARLEQEAAEADAALQEAASRKQEALDAQSAARTAYEATLPKAVPTTRRAPTATSFHDEESARAFIVMKESGGNYNARNGRYIGAYQLTNTYLNGDYSPENQDRVAEQYVRNRYGSWMGAANFWVSHGWY